MTSSLCHACSVSLATVQYANGQDLCRSCADALTAANQAKLAAARQRRIERAGECTCEEPPGDCERCVEEAAS